MNLFGYELIKKEDPQKIAETQPSFVPKDYDDGALVVAAAGAYGTYLDLEGAVRTEADLVTKYRDMSMNAEVDAAINEVVNECISVQEEDVVKIKLEDVEATDKIKDAIQDAFDEVLLLMNFNQNGYQIIRRWFVDGRLNYHTVIDIKATKDGIKELRYVDPRKIRKIREIVKRRSTASDNMGPEGTIVQVRNEYYIYNERGFDIKPTGIQGGAGTGGTATGIKIAADSVVTITSGVTDSNGQLVLSYLHKAIKPLNQLRAMEDSSVIYRLARAPERRVWYIDVGNLPKMKAEQYVRDIMTKHKNKLVYDVNTGDIRDDRKFQTMLEDYWLPRREGGKGTEVETLPGGENLGQMDDVLYFQQKLYSSLNVPISRLNKDNPFSLGRATEISRDEVSFGDFIARLRNRFGEIFTKILEKHCVLKEIVSLEDFKRLAPMIKYDFASDNYFREMAENEVMIGRMDLLDRVAPYVGRYYSDDWVNKYILRLNEEEVEEMREQIEENAVDPIYSQPMPGQEQPMDGMMGMGPDDDMMGMDSPPMGAGIDPAAGADAPGGDPNKPHDPNRSSSIQQRKLPKEKKHAQPPGGAVGLPKGGARGKDKKSDKKK